jgi:hypothetical protein
MEENMKITNEQITIAEDQLSFRAATDTSPTNQASLQGFTEALQSLGLSWKIRADGTAEIWSNED